MTKREACEYLGKSKRTVETFVSKGRLGVAYVDGPNGKTAAFRRSEVEALKREIDTPTYRATPEVATSRPARFADGSTVTMRPALVEASSGSSSDTLAMVTTALARAVQAAAADAPAPKPWLTLAEAVEYSGLPASYLVRRAREGWTAAIDVGTGDKAFWRFNREGLTR